MGHMSHRCISLAHAARTVLGRYTVLGKVVPLKSCVNCAQAADEEELVHLQALLTQSQAAEAEAVRRASEATEQLSATSAQHVCQVESDLQQVWLSCS